MKPVVWLASAAWSSGSLLAREAAKRGFLSVTRLDARVISVGNLQAGGAGKTPLVAQIAREASARGMKTCILTRGYRGKWESGGGVIAPGGAPEDPTLTGDEPALLHELVPSAWIAVGSDRVRQFEKAKASAGAFDLVILDDGFQNWRIRKDLEILALTSDCFGARVFRDWPRATRRADLVIWTKGHQQPETYGAPMVAVRYRLSAKSDKPLWLITGVADPASVARSARELGLELRKELRLSDHARYGRDEVFSWVKSARREGCKVALTGKDWVKWRPLGISAEDVVVLEPELVFESGRELWEEKLWG